MADVVNLTIAQFQPKKGDYSGNLKRFEQLFESFMSADPRPDVIAFSETVLTGYFVEGGVRDVAVPASTFALALPRVLRALHRTGGCGCGILRAARKHVFQQRDLRHARR